MAEDGSAEEHRDDPRELAPFAEEVGDVACEDGEGHLRNALLLHQEAQVLEDDRGQEASHEANEDGASHYLQKPQDEEPHVGALDVETGVVAVHHHLPDGVEQRQRNGILVKRLSKHNREQLRIPRLVHHLLSHDRLDTAEGRSHQQDLPVRQRKHVLRVTHAHVQIYFMHIVLRELNKVSKPQTQRKFRIVPIRP
jgi:hypothetical protein